jgi:hypothetical protein
VTRADLARRVAKLRATLDALQAVSSGGVVVQRPGESVEAAAARRVGPCIVVPPVAIDVAAWQAEAAAYMAHLQARADLLAGTDTNLNEMG